MNKKFAFLFGLFGLAASASAATDVVWSDEDGVKTTKEPAYSYTFDYGDGASIDTTNVNDAKVLDFSVPSGKESAGAGYGFGWMQNASYKDVAISLSAYKGACIVYEATAPFRVDFKQSTITDDNYYGQELAAAANPKKVFVAFADLTQGWKSSKTVAWNAASQMGVQFSFKNTHANAAKKETNAVVLHSFTMADECVTNAPNVTESFAALGIDSVKITEGGAYSLNMAEVFEDADGDDLTITVKIENETPSVKLVDSTAYDQNSVIQFTTYSNPKSDAKITLTATDPTKKTATFSFTLVTEDVENAPVAKNSSFEVLEDSVLKVGISGRLTQYGSDADGDEINLVLVDATKHGSLSLNEELGTFNYTPDPDFFGLDSFSYKFVEAGNSESESNLAYGIITVVGVNDLPEVTYLEKTFLDANGDEHTFGDTLVVDEDFDEFMISIPKENVTVTDADGDDDYKFSAKTSGVLNAEYVASSSAHNIAVTAKRDSNGVAKISLVVSDPKVSLPTVIAVVKVNPVADPITPVDDTYDVYQDSVNVIAAKEGVLANDRNPDGDTTSTLEVQYEPEHGKLTLNNDGSFTYEAEADYEGEDAFVYKVISAAGDTSKSAIVTLNVLHKNRAPQIVAGVMDTVSQRLDTLREDFSIVVYKKAEILSWFEDDVTAANKLKFTVVSEDSSLAVSLISTTGNLQIKSVRDVCGEATATLTATDEGGASTDLVLTAHLTCVNDKPVVKNDTVYIPVAGWSTAYDLNKLATDADGDSLSFRVVENLTYEAYFDWSQEDNTLNIAAIEGVTLENGNIFVFSVKVADSTMANSKPATTLTAKLVIIVGDDPTSIKPVIATPKASWQNAILANRGSAAMLDMQGRVIWKQKLPVNEADVRAAASQVQGRKILKVNHQTYTIK